MSIITFEDWRRPTCAYCGRRIVVPGVSAERLDGPERYCGYEHGVAAQDEHAVPVRISGD